MNTLLVIVAICVLVIVVWEVWKPRFEGFTAGGTLSGIIKQTIPRRFDVTLDNDLSEEAPYVRDRRYWAGYTDVQRLGISGDFCRVVENRRNPKDKFLACALAGTEGLDSYSYRTQTIQEGLELSRDDYMALPGRLGPSAAYCRILKTTDGWQSMCNSGGLGSFQTVLTQDTMPPREIERLLRFFTGILIWYRFHDDILDYAKNTTVSAAGGIAIDETPSRRDMPPIPGKPMSEGLRFNGKDEYLRIGENTQLQLGFAVPVRTIRAVAFWVRFDEFTNWTRIFDFGEGGNKNSIFCGIEQRGNPGIDTGGSLLPQSDGPMLAAQVNEVCRPPTHAPEVTPQHLLKTTAANVDEFACPLPDSDADERPTGALPLEATPAKPPTANLIFEIWDAQQRKMRIRIVDFYVLGQWTHVCLTTTTADAQRPSWTIYRNGAPVYTQEDGWLAQTNLTTHNYIGRSTDEDPTAQWADKTERFKGRLYDFRVYQIPLSQSIIIDTVAWGKEALTQSKIETKKNKID